MKIVGLAERFTCSINGTDWSTSWIKKCNANFCIESLVSNGLKFDATKTEFRINWILPNILPKLLFSNVVIQLNNKHIQNHHDIMNKVLQDFHVQLWCHQIHFFAKIVQVNYIKSTWSNCHIFIITANIPMKAYITLVCSEMGHGPVRLVAEEQYCLFVI